LKLVELSSPFIIYSDLDGVLVDFLGSAKKFLPKVGFDPSNNDEEEYFTNPKIHHEFGKAIARYQEKYGYTFWEHLLPTPGAHELWNYIRNKNVQILTAVGDPQHHAARQKTEWVKRYLGSKVKINFVPHAKDKARYAAPDRVLIDDQLKAVIPFREAGGHAVHYEKNAAKAIEQLKKLGI
jgi:FMN phosphatase YigB (HAD superfamily)